MIRTRVCDLLKIDHPIALGGMGSIYAPDLVSAVSNAGGLGAMGCHNLGPEQIRSGTEAIRAKTNKPFGLNFLLFCVQEEALAAALELRPSVIAYAWPRPEQDLRPFIDRAHDAGAKVTFMVGSVPEAVRAAKAGADIVVAQGTEGGG
ncbi:MAG TPA: nitronate monooxygenase, partial [Stellaceae bacterium]|nr:nitronate monooxygenase [Stellaceae bacterium]